VALPAPGGYASVVNWRPAILAFALSAAALAADQSLTLKVDGWHSKGDAYKTEQAVQQVKGVRSASADAAKKELTVVFDDAVASEASVRKAISEAGYSGHR
jgi:copper chaperone CopZ